jgi:hypothetical protein
MSDIVLHEPKTPVIPSVSLLPAVAMKGVLAEYSERRNTFRKWLLDQMVQGVHYGVPPGCEVKLDPQGNIVAWSKSKGNYSVSREQWRARPSLYKAGAQLLCDLLKLRPEFTSDEAAWRMLGSRDGLCVVRCRLINIGGPFFADKEPGDLIGEGVGAFEVGEKGMNANSALKMAGKRAMVDAVINACGIADLFTQDVEDKQPEKKEQPEAKPDAPKVAPRAERQPSPIKDQLNALLQTWATKMNEGVLDLGSFATWAKMKLKTDKDLTKLSAWNVDAIQNIQEELR